MENIHIKTSLTENSYNGSNIKDRNTNELIYSWSQSLNDLEITIPVCSSVTGKKQCKIEIAKASLKVSLNEHETLDWQTRLSGELTYSIRTNSSCWTLESGRFLRIYLDKEEPRWWNSLLKNEEKIDLNKLERTIGYDQLSLEEQNLVQQLTYQQLDKNS